MPNPVLSVALGALGSGVPTAASIHAVLLDPGSAQPREIGFRLDRGTPPCTWSPPLGQPLSPTARVTVSTGLKEASGAIGGAPPLAVGEHRPVAGRLEPLGQGHRRGQAPRHAGRCGELAFDRNDGPTRWGFFGATVAQRVYDVEATYHGRDGEPKLEQQWRDRGALHSAECAGRRLVSRFERLHPAIGRALALWPERGTAELAAEVVERALAALPRDPGDAAWRASRLGRQGFPLELAFTVGPCAETSLRYTTEVDRPDRPADRRLASVLTLAASLGERGWPGEVVAVLARLHRDHRDALTYGAWLGVRHRGELELKLYAELPGTAGRILTDELESTWSYRTWGGARPILLGVERERLEVYYQALAPMPHELAAVLERAGVGAARAPAVLALLERAYGLSLERGMPAPEVGFSYALGRDEEGEPRCLAFTLYHYANTVFGGDGAIRRGLLDLIARQGADAGTYGAVSRPLEGRVGGDPHHGMFGIVVPRRGELLLAFGLAPPSPHGSAH